jgi:type VI secretion system protein ImpC
MPAATEQKPQGEATAGATQTAQPSEALEAMERSISARSEEDKQEVRSALRDLVKLALDKSKTESIPRNIGRLIKDLKAGIDRKISEQLNEIMHHADFQALEGSWRGLSYLINNSELEADRLEVHVMNISKDELTSTLKDYEGDAWQQSPLYDKIYSQEFGVFGGRPFGCLMGDYYFNHSVEDVETLEGMSKIAAASFAPFISSVDPSLFGFKDWRDLPKKKELKEIFTSKKYLRWNKMRKDNLDTRFLGLTFPRILAREPWGEGGRKVKEFSFEEEAGAHDRYCWTNAAYAMARNIGQAFKEYGWAVQIRGRESGGLVENLPLHMYETSDGSTEVKIPSEVLIPDQRENELSKLGFLPIVYIKNSPDAVFVGGQSVHNPWEYGGAKGKVATANHALSARLPYTFAVSRFAHYLKCMVRDKIGSLMEEKELTAWLNDWLSDYILENPENAGLKVKAEKPLMKGEIKIEPVEGNPGFYNSKLSLRPHYQLEGMTTDIVLDTQLTQAQG